MKISFAKSSILLALTVPFVAGCPGSTSSQPASPPTTPGPQRTLHVLVIDDEGLAEAIERQWQARSDTAVELRRTTSAEVIAAGNDSLGADVVVFPSGLLGEFAEREQIVPLGKDTLESQEFDGQDVFEVLRRGETTWGKEAFAVSLGSPQLTIIYRQDILESLELLPPTTWSAYQQLVNRLADRDSLGDYKPPAGEPWFAAREPLGEGWAGQLLLARAAAYVRHPHQYSTLFDLRDMRPLIDGPPFVKALEELVDAAQPTASAQPGGTHAATPADVRQEFLAGRCAMALTWPSPADPPGAELPAGASMQVGFAELPGSTEVFNVREQSWEDRDDAATVPLLASAGRLVALTRSGRRSTSANTMLLWLGGTELGSTVSPTSKATTLFRGSQVGNARRWINPQLGDGAASAYAELVSRTQNQSIWLSSIRLPARQRYLTALDQAVQQALAGEPAADVLATAASEWQEITDELGRDEQKNAYMRSLGLEP